MKKHIALCATTFILTMCTTLSSMGQGVTIPTRFGVNAGGCSGRGVCSATCTDQPVNVTYSYSTTTKKLTMQFDLTQEEQNEIAQDIYWMGNPTTYSFDFPYDISVNNPVLSQLNIPARTIIPVASGFQVSYSSIPSTQDISATMTVSTFLAQPVNTKVIFGCPRAGYGLINTISSTPISVPVDYNNGVGVQTSRAIPVLIALAPGHADTLVLVFRDTALTNGQHLSFPGDLGGSGSFRLNYMPLNQTGLPYYAYYQQGGAIRFSQSETGNDSIFIAYAMPIIPFSSAPVMATTGYALDNITWTTNYTPPTWGVGLNTNLQANIYSYTANNFSDSTTFFKIATGSGAGLGLTLNPGTKYCYTLSYSYFFPGTGYGAYGGYNTTFTSATYIIPPNN
jgi:hypothetical protein